MRSPNLASPGRFIFNQNAMARDIAEVKVRIARTIRA
jgi:hypothetical protein